MAPKGTAVFATTFDVEDPAGAAVLTHILPNSNGGSSLPTRSTSSPLTGVASLLFNKAAGVALDATSNYYATFTARSALSHTFKIAFTTLPATDGNGAGIVSYVVDGEAWGVYRTGGSSRVALFSLTNQVAWYGSTALVAGTTYFVTYTLRFDGSGTYPAMLILRDSSGTEIERSPWVRLDMTSTSPSTFNLIAIGSVAGTSGWTEAFAYKMDCVLGVAGGVHAPKEVHGYLLPANAAPTLTGTGGPRAFSGTAQAGTTASSVVVSGNLTGADTVLNFYLYYPGAGAAPRNQRITAVSHAAGLTTLTLAGALGADPIGATVEIYGWGLDTDDDGLLYDEVDDAAPADDATTTLSAINTAAKNVGFAHPTLASVGGPASLAADEKLYLQLWARVRGTTAGTGSSVFSTRWWDGAVGVIGSQGATVTTSWGWCPLATSGQRIPQMFRPGGAEWDLATVNALEIGVSCTANSTTNVRLLSYVAMEVFHITEWDDTFDSGVTMREINHTTSTRRPMPMVQEVQ